MSEDPDPDRLKRLEERIAAMKKAGERQPGPEEHYSAASQGWRMVIELVSGLGIGFLAGYGLDWFFGTMPLFLVVLTLLGFAAGVNVMLRTARELQKDKAAGAVAGNEQSAAPAVRDEGE